MYKLCKTEQSANRQRQLEQGLLSMMAETQYDQISVSDLCTLTREQTCSHCTGSSF